VYVRKKKNKSGVISVQVIDTSGSVDRLLKTIGHSADEEEVSNLVRQAHQFIVEYTHQKEFVFNTLPKEKFVNTLKTGLKKVQVIGPELILGKLFDEIGFNQVPDEFFRHLVLSRLIFPSSKLKTSEYLLRYQNVVLEVDSIYRYLDKLESQRDIVQRISFEHTLKLFNGEISIVFYDVTTLYFEVSDEDDLRKTGFSKEGKHQHPQIVLGLLVSLYGYPLAFEIYEGNKFEGHTLIPVVEGFKQKYNLNKLVVIADAGLLSRENIAELLKHGYEFILGARIKNESNALKKAILGYNYTDGHSVVLKRDESTNLIVSFALARARKDERNRQRGLAKLERQLNKGRLTKQQINNRGYNKYLKLDGQVKITIDYDRFNADSKWDGLKGYITNCQLPKEEVIENYKHLWQIEKAFRISKTDLRIRPIYHRLGKRISAHMIIAFSAYKLYKELERQLKEKKSTLSTEKALELMKTIYRLNIVLPNTEEPIHLYFAEENSQQELLKLFDIKLNPD
jgi:transposase